MWQARERFIQERMCGYRDGKGDFHKPVARSTAVRAWGKQRPHFVKAMKDPEVRQKLKLDEP